MRDAWSSDHISTEPTCLLFCEIRWEYLQKKHALYRVTNEEAGGHHDRNRIHDQVWLVMVFLQSFGGLKVK